MARGSAQSGVIGERGQLVAQAEAQQRPHLVDGVLARDAAATVFALKRPTYPRYVASVMVACVGLAFVMPSTTGRILLLIPIVLALADRIGLTEGRRGRTGLVMTVAAAAITPAPPMPYPIPPMVSQLIGINA